MSRRIDRDADKLIAMKLQRLILGLLFLAGLFTISAIAQDVTLTNTGSTTGTVWVVVETNGVPTNAAPDFVGPLKPVLELLPASWLPFLTKLIIWMGSASLVFGGFSVKIQHWLTNRLNNAAASSELDDDEWLRRLFANPIYRFLATALRFFSIRLPTTDDLERAVAQQAEAVAIAKSKGVVPS